MCCFPFPLLAIDTPELLTVTSCPLLSLSFSCLLQAGSGIVNETGKAFESATVRRVVMWFTVRVSGWVGVVLGCKKVRVCV